MFDQAGLVREIVKWDYALRTPDQSADVVARAMEIMMASPRGPAYLMLPREVIGGAVRLSNAPMVQRAVPATAYPDPQEIETLAQMIAAAERPVIIAANSGRKRLTESRAQMRKEWAETSAAAGKSDAIKPEWLSHCLGVALPEDAIVVNEYPLLAEDCPRELAGTYFGLSPAGCLGWGFGAA